MFPAFPPEICLQCKRQTVGPSSRLVQDSCGHRKCRSCLLQDEEICKQCANIAIKIEQNGSLLENHVNDIKTGTIRLESNSVIQCNGKGQIKEWRKEYDSESTLNGDKHCIINDSEINTSNQLTSTCSYDETLPSDLKKNKVEPTTKKHGKLRHKREYNSIIMPDHVKQLEDSLLYHCNKCNRSFSTKAHVKYHVYCSNEGKPHKCSQCPKEFILKAQLELHKKKHSDVRPYCCSICQRLFSERSKLNRHTKLHGTEKSHICTECGKAFRSKESLRTHSFIHKGLKPYSCKLCSAKFTDSSNMKKHLLSHSKEKSHMCDQCGKRFKLKWALSVHRKSHLRVRPYECTICEKNFVYSKDLQRHNLIHSETKGYTCSLCRASFRRKDNLNRHMKNTHPGKTGEVIKNVVKSPELPSKKPIVDNPNAINVITASPAFTKSKVAEAAQPVISTDSRPGTVINGPIKLAFKTPAFKSVYNINRNFSYIPPPQIQKPFDLAESVDICKKILLPDSSLLSTAEKKTDETTITSAEICQQILTPNSSVPPIHYETSFQNRKHAMIKNIKFKVPIQYTNNFKPNSSMTKDITSVQPQEIIQIDINHSVTKSSPSDDSDSTAKVYTELKPVKTSLATSVIVNNSNASNVSQVSGDIHWRRKTLQNLYSKN